MFLGGVKLFSSIIGAWFWIFFATAVFSQRTITLDGDKCAADLEIMRAITGARIELVSPPRRLLGTCELKDARIAFRNPDVALTIARMQWQGDAVPQFAVKLLPDTFRFSAAGVVLKQSPFNEPIWLFLAEQSQRPGGVSTTFGFSYSSQDKRLSVEQASIGFDNDARISAAIDMHDVSPELLRDPKLLGMDLNVQRLTVSIDGKSQFYQSLVAAILPPTLREMEIEDFKLAARKYVVTELTYLLARPDNSELRVLISELPTLSDNVSIGFDAEYGVPAARIIALIKGAKPDWASDGVVLSFHYGASDVQASSP